MPYRCKLDLEARYLGRSCSESFGHSDATMTVNVYSHVIPGMQKKSSRKMDEITAIIDDNELFEKVDGQNGL